MGKYDFPPVTKRMVEGVKKEVELEHRRLKGPSFSQKVKFVDKMLSKLGASFRLEEENYKNIPHDYTLVTKMYDLLSKDNPSFYEIYELCGIQNNLTIKDDFPLFVVHMKLNTELMKETGESFDEYPFSIPIIKSFREIKFHKPVTFFIGGNGIGKSTLLEALAVKFEIPAEGGTKNYHYHTHDTHSCLYQYLNTASSYRRPKEVFFFRAETFYNFATEYANINSDAYHECSHGESFMLLAESRFKSNSLYILDEPEAALSFDSQLQLLYIINELTKQGSQFIIATHSPILLSLPDAEIMNLENRFERVEYEDTKIYKQYKSFLNNHKGYLHHLLQEEKK